MACQQKSRKVRLQGLSVRLPRSRGRPAPSPMEPLSRPGRLRAMFRRAPSTEGPFPLTTGSSSIARRFPSAQENPDRYKMNIDNITPPSPSGICLDISSFPSSSCPSPHLSEGDPLARRRPPASGACAGFATAQPSIACRRWPTGFHAVSWAGAPCRVSFPSERFPFARLPQEKEDMSVKGRFGAPVFRFSSGKGKGLLSFGATFLSRICG